MDHPPSPEELAEIYKQADEKDPRSVFYKRVLIRPKFPTGKLLLFFLLFTVVAIVVYFNLLYVCHIWPVAALGSLVSVALVAVMLGKPVVITLVQSYQAIAPDKTRQRCRYEPSCSLYMIQAVEKYGFWCGIKKGLKRWKNCKPPNGGIDIP